jgi:hypothetical protein
MILDCRGLGAEAATLLCKLLKNYLAKLKIVNVIDRIDSYSLESC